MGWWKWDGFGVGDELARGRRQEVGGRRWEVGGRRHGARVWCDVVLVVLMVVLVLVVLLDGCGWDGDGDLSRGLWG